MSNEFIECDTNKSLTSIPENLVPGEALLSLSSVPSALWESGGQCMYGFRVWQGGRTWQAFGGGKHGHETFREARNYNFRDKCVVFARNLKFLNLTQ